jgi:hypothetical protein
MFTLFWLLQVKYTGYRAITAGLQADTFIEAFDVEKQKQEYSAMMAEKEQHAALVRLFSVFLTCFWL